MMSDCIPHLSKYGIIQCLGFRHCEEEVLPGLQELQKTSREEGDEPIRVQQLQKNGGDHPHPCIVCHLRGFHGKH